MRKAVYHGIRDVRVEEVDEPVAGYQEAKIKVRYCGICGSDLHEYIHGPFPASPFGHEVCGEIIEVGAATEGFEVGDHVLSLNRDGYAEYQVTPQSMLQKLPNEMSWERAVMLEPLAGSANAIERGGIKPGDTVFIAGAGPVGLTLLMGARALGAQAVYMSEISENRRAKAEELGATAVLNPLETKIPPGIRELTGGQGVDVSIEAVGIEESLKDCLASTRYRGTVVVQGIFTERARVHMLAFVSKEMTMVGCNSLALGLALEWTMAKGLELEKIVTSIIPLDQISEKGFDILADDKEKDIKILVEPWLETG
jgi:(R,R)-butanediol dehydrogenase/meso-butanediol dehydrogenase/diacetyl reductase